MVEFSLYANVLDDLMASLFNEIDYSHDYSVESRELREILYKPI